MTEKEFKLLCTETSPGTALTFKFRDQEVLGNFVGCAKDAVVIEANGRAYFCPRELCSYEKLTYAGPSYS